MDFDYVVVPGLILLVGIVVIWLSLRRILSHSAKVANRWRRVVERIILSGVILFAFVIAGCASYTRLLCFGSGRTIRRLERVTRLTATRFTLTAQGAGRRRLFLMRGSATTR